MTGELLWQQRREFLRIDDEDLAALTVVMPDYPSPLALMGAKMFEHLGIRIARAPFAIDPAAAGLDANDLTDAQRAYLDGHDGNLETALKSGGFPLTEAQKTALQKERARLFTQARLMAQGSDIVLMPGSAPDMRPECYGAKPHPETDVDRNPFNLRQDIDTELVTAAIKDNIPYCGLCYGMQLFTYIYSVFQHAQGQIAETLAQKDASLDEKTRRRLARARIDGEHIRHLVALKEQAPAAFDTVALIQDVPDYLSGKIEDAAGNTHAPVSEDEQVAHRLPEYAYIGRDRLQAWVEAHYEDSLSEAPETNIFVEAKVETRHETLLTGGGTTISCLLGQAGQPRWTELSSHHQAVDESSLKEDWGMYVSARAPDGIVEAVEIGRNAYGEAPFMVMAVQPHPETNAGGLASEIARSFAAMGVLRKKLFEAGYEVAAADMPTYPEFVALEREFYDTDEKPAGDDALPPLAAWVADRRGLTRRAGDVSDDNTRQSAVT